MNKSESIKQISAALAAAQAEMPPVKFNKTNGFLGNRYADLGAILATAQPVLARHGLAVSQLCVSHGDSVGVETVLVHSSGEFISSVVAIPPSAEKGKSAAQVAGSLITYFRRYALASVLGMYAEEDTDGSHPPTKPQAARRPRVFHKPNPITQDAAYAVKNRDGVPYVDLDVEKLSIMRSALTKSINSKETQANPTKLAAQLHKLAAANYILNNNGSKPA